MPEDTTPDTGENDRKVEYDVFLSYNSKDAIAVEQIASRLRQRVSVFLDRWHLVPGDELPRELETAISRSSCVVTFYGSHGPGPWHDLESQTALRLQRKRQNDFRVIPVLLPQGKREQMGEFLQNFLWVEFRSLDDEDAFERLIGGIEGRAPQSPDFELRDDPRPYRGLAPFEAEQQDFFFGRDDYVEVLIKRLSSEEPFVTVAGASGSGKSSLVKAGLYTDYAKQLQSDIEFWSRIILTPSDDPLRALVNQVLSLADKVNMPRDPRDGVAWVNQQIDHFLREDDGLCALLSLLHQHQRQPYPILLVVDQLEELLTHTGSARDKERIDRFLANLYVGLARKPPWLRVVFTARSDFLDDVKQEYSNLGPVLRAPIWLSAPDENDLREMIVMPAEKRGALFEVGLVEEILRDMSELTNGLPLLEEALEGLWKNRRGRWLTHDGYQACGRVGGALASHADAAYRALDGSEQDCARRILISLIQVGEGSADTRRKVSVSRLVTSKDDRTKVESVLNKLASRDSRLVTLGGSPEGDSFAEITHEALIRHWPPLRDWLNERRSELRILRRLEVDAEDWHGSHSEDALWRGSRLSLLDELAERRMDDFTSIQKEFYEQSILVANRQRMAEEAARRKELEHARHLAELQRKRFRLAAGLGVVALGFAVVAGRLLVSEREAKEAARTRLFTNYWILGESARDVAKDSLKATHYFVRAAETAGNSLGERNSRRAAAFLYGNVELISLSEQVNAIGKGPSNKMLLSKERSLLMWNDITRSWEKALEHAGNKTVFDASGTRAFVWQTRGLGEVWDISSRSKLNRKAFPYIPDSASFSSSTTAVLVKDENKIVRAWNYVSGEIRTFPKAVSNPIAEYIGTGEVIVGFQEPDGHTYHIALWNPERGGFVASEPLTGTLWALVFDPHRNSFVSLTQEGIAILWESRTAKPISSPVRLDMDETNAAISRDGRHILIWGKSLDGEKEPKAKYWRFGETPVPEPVPLPIAQHIRGGAFTNNASQFIFWADDNRVRALEISALPTREPKVVVIADHPTTVDGVVLADDDRTLAVWGRKEAQIWATQVAYPLTPPLIHDGPIEEVLFGPNKQEITTRTENGTVRVWHVDTQSNSVSAPMMHQNETVVDAEFVRDTSSVLTATTSGKVQLWDRVGNRVGSGGNLGEIDGGPVIAPGGSKVVGWQGSNAILANIDVAKADLGLNSTVLPHSDSRIVGAKFGWTGDQILTWDTAGVVRLWDGHGKVQVALPKTGDRIAGVVLNKRQDRVFVWTGNESGGSSGEVWSTQARNLANTQRTSMIKGASFNPREDKLLFWDNFGNVLEWDFVGDPEGRKLSKIENTAKVAAGGCYAPSGNQMLVWHGSSATIDALPNQSRFAYVPPHRGDIRGCSYAADESWVVTWADDQALVWDLAPTKSNVPVSNAVNLRSLTFPLVHDGIVSGARLKPDGNRLLTWDDRGTVWSWNLAVDNVESKQLRRTIYELHTGSRLEESGALVPLSEAEWAALRTKTATPLR
jgi:WD40 repeat protein